MEHPLLQKIEIGGDILATISAFFHSKSPFNLKSHCIQSALCLSLQPFKIEFVSEVNVASSSMMVVGVLPAGHVKSGGQVLAANQPACVRWKIKTVNAALDASLYYVRGIINKHQWSESGVIDVQTRRPISAQDITTLNLLIHFINNASIQDLVGRAEQVRWLFFVALRPYPYDRGFISRRGSIEFILDTRVYYSHDALDVSDPGSGRRVHETLLEAQFANRLGVRCEKANSIQHSCVYLRDRNQQRIGVFEQTIG